MPLRSELSPDDEIDAAGDLRTDLDPGTAQNGVTTYLAGQPTIWAGFQEFSKEDLSEAEMSGFPIVAIILLVVFGSLAAAALPLALGFVSVIVTGALIYFISLQMTTSVFVTNMASMIGIGVAIDYSLFILARYREERDAGRTDEEALDRALSTSGLAVTFSGLAVIVSLAGLWMVDNQALRSMALGAMTVVAVSILTATTLLPTLIAFLGDRVMPGGSWLGPSTSSAALSGATRPRVPPLRPRLPFKVDPPPHIIPPSPLLPLGPEETQMDWPSLPRPGMAGRPRAMEFLGAVDSKRHGSSLGRRDRGDIGPAVPGDPAAIDRHRHRGGQAVPEGERRARRQRTRVREAGWRRRPDPDRRRIRGRPRTRRGRRVRRRAQIDSRGQLGLAALDRRRERPLPGDLDARRASPTPPRRWSTRLRDTVVPSSRLAEVATVDVGGETARIDDVRSQIGGSMWKIVLFVLDPQLPRPDGDAALAAAAAEGGADEPALDRRRVRNPRRDLPVGVVRQRPRVRKPGRPRHDQRAADLRDRLRPLDGLRGVPDVADPRALHAAPGQRTRRRRRALDRAPGRSPRRR